MFKNSRLKSGNCSLSLRSSRSSSVSTLFEMPSSSASRSSSALPQAFTTSEKQLRRTFTSSSVPPCIPPLVLTRTSALCIIAKSTPTWHPRTAAAPTLPFPTPFTARMALSTSHFVTSAPQGYIIRNLTTPETSPPKPRLAAVVLSPTPFIMSAMPLVTPCTTSSYPTPYSSSILVTNSLQLATQPWSSPSSKTLSTVLSLPIVSPN
mmetsp:Transcript_25350/g.52672  ORF Transcript_25350/g.52672 Transcript_25350/m.52672 type:complete len:207 (+) Transcript_25350:221-841(+)